MDENIKKEANEKREESVRIDESTNSAPELKVCPYCGETILATARKCKHCGEWLQDGGSTRNATVVAARVSVEPRISNNPPKYKYYRMIFLYWTVIFLTIFFSTKEVFYGLADLCNVLVFIYFTVGLKKYAQYKGGCSSAFAWLIVLSAVLLPIDWLIDGLYADGKEGNILIFLAGIGLLLGIGYYVALFLIRKRFKTIGESYLVKSLTVYIIVSIIVNVIMLIEMPLGVVESLFVCFVDLCFYFAWCKFFSDKENEESMDVDMKKKPFWRKMVNSYVDVLIIVGLIGITTILLNLAYLLING